MNQENLFIPISSNKLETLSLREFISEYLNIPNVVKQHLCGEIEVFMSSRDKMVQQKINIEGRDVDCVNVEFEGEGLHRLLEMMAAFDHVFLEQFLALLFCGESIDSHEMEGEVSLKVMGLINGHPLDDDDDDVCPPQLTPSKNRVIH